jgi:MFS family permease
MEQYQKNLIKLYAYAFFQSFLVLIPVIVPYWQNKGISLKEIFLLQAIFGFTLIIFDLPAGYMADLLGRKKMLLLGSFISALGFQILWFGETFFHFVIYEIVLGIGLSFQSGCDIAILYSSLEKLELKTRTARYLGLRITSSTLGEGVASLLGGLFALISLNFPAYMNAATAWIPFAIALTIYEPEDKKLSRDSHFKNIVLIKKALFGHSKFLTFAIFNFIFYGFATYCAVWSLQPYWKQKGIPVIYFGYLWATNSFLSAYMSRYAHAIEEKLGSTKVILIISILPVIGYLGMGLTPGLGAIVFALAFPLCRGLNQVLFQDAINSRVPAEMRATTNSIGSLGMRMLFILFGPLLGKVLDEKGPPEAMKIMGLIYLIGFFVVALPLLSQRNEFKIN